MTSSVNICGKNVTITIINDETFYSAKDIAVAAGATKGDNISRQIKMLHKKSKGLSPFIKYRCRWFMSKDGIVVLSRRGTRLRYDDVLKWLHAPATKTLKAAQVQQSKLLKFSRFVTKNQSNMRTAVDMVLNQTKRDNMAIPASLQDLNLTDTMLWRLRDHPDREQLRRFLMHVVELKDDWNMHVILQHLESSPVYANLARDFKVACNPFKYNDARQFIPTALNTLSKKIGKVTMIKQD